jgi:SAM-dependent methyltransferase/GT2 family glycosyltransferase
MTPSQGDGRYHFAYTEDSVYARAMALVADHACGEGVHLDLGCGFGAIAEKVREQGLTYVGFDLDPSALEDLQRRGFETATIDLRDVPGTLAVLDGVLDGRPVASISLLDTLEHITTGRELLIGLRARASATNAPLVVSVPNIAHRDVALKLLTGRFDYTPTGLLDSTHLVHHTSALLDAVMVTTGWREVAALDLRLERSDQHFPVDHAALAEASTLHRFLVGLRDRTGEHADTNQFVRAYLPGATREVPLLADPSEGRNRPFLTVVVRTQGKRPATLRDALLCLLAQTDQDFEVVVTVHRATSEERAVVESVVSEMPRSLRERVRLLDVEGGGRARPLNEALLTARGSYLAVLDDDDLVLAHWVESFAAVAVNAPGMVLRAVCVEQAIEPDAWAGQASGFRATGALRNVYPNRFDLISHMGRNHTPFMGYAFPRTLFRDLGMRFDESLDICEDWDFELRAALTVGVASTPEVTAVYRRWAAGNSSASLHDVDEWRRTEKAILAKIDAVPNLFPAGTIAAIREAALHGQERVEREIQALVGRNRELEEQALRMEQSTSWRLTRPLRAVMRLVRRSD